MQGAILYLIVFPLKRSVKYKKHYITHNRNFTKILKRKHFLQIKKICVSNLLSLTENVDWYIYARRSLNNKYTWKKWGGGD